MRIVIEIDDSQSGTTQSPTTKIYTESTASSSSATGSATTTAASFRTGMDAGAAPAAGLTQTGSSMPFIPLPSAMAATAETGRSDSSAGAAPGESKETLSLAENSAGTENEEY